MYMAWKKGEKKDLRVRQRQGERTGSLSSPVIIHLTSVQSKYKVSAIAKRLAAWL